MASGVWGTALRLGLGNLAVLAFPASCILCRSSLDRPLDGPLCYECLQSLPRIRQPYCPRCGLPYEEGVAPGLCGSCRGGPRRRRFRLARAAGPYEGDLRESLIHLKFRGRQRIASSLGRFAFERCVLSDALEKPVAVVPVPLGRIRRRQRGYNQAELLAVAIARLAEVPMKRRVLVKSKERPPQAELSAEARWRNAVGAYQARIPSRLFGKPLLLVDDVFTTGATVEACTRALLKAGAGLVDVLTVARVR
jgi:ComF family protein